jgi:hemolysin III
VVVRFSPEEERANALSSGSGVVLSVLALGVLSRDAWGGDPLHIISGVVFACSMVVLYLCSALNHALAPGPAKEFFFKADLAAIYVLISGSYTPVMLVGLGDELGIVLTLSIWALALVGVVRTLRAEHIFSEGVDRITLVSYLVMGWFLLVAPMEFYDALSGSALTWIAIGGAFYTGGVAFFRWHSLKYHHLLWHLCVLGGSISHFVAVRWYILK